MAIFEIYSKYTIVYTVWKTLTFPDLPKVYSGPTSESQPTVTMVYTNR